MQNISKSGKTIILKDTSCALSVWCMEVQPFLPPSTFHKHCGPDNTRRSAALLDFSLSPEL